MRIQFYNQRILFTLRYLRLYFVENDIVAELMNSCYSITPETFILIVMRSKLQI